MSDESETQQTAFRLPTSLIARLDKYAERLMQEQKGMNVTRADVVRLLLTRELDRIDQKNAPFRAIPKKKR